MKYRPSDMPPGVVGGTQSDESIGRDAADRLIQDEREAFKWKGLDTTIEWERYRRNELLGAALRALDIAEERIAALVVELGWPSTKK
mgnify:CR=1 FL=1